MLTGDQKLSSPLSSFQFSTPEILFMSSSVFPPQIKNRLKIEIAQKRKVSYSQHCIKLHLYKDLVEKERERRDEQETNRAFLGSQEDEGWAVRKTRTSKLNLEGT